MITAKSIFLSCICFFSLVFAHAQQQYLRNYTIEQGLAGISVSCMLQDSRGYIWIGTKDGGVSRFDGKTFINYRKKDGLGDNAINCMYEDTLGNMWFGTEKNGITKYDGSEFTQYTNLPVSTIDKIFSDKTGKILVYSYPQLYIFHDDTLLTLNENGRGSTLQNFLISGGPKYYKSITDTKGNKWIATYSGVYVVDKKFAADSDYADHKILFPLTTNDEQQPATALLQDKEGNIWIGTEYNGVYMYADGAFSNFGNIKSLDHAYITSINQIENTFFVGTANGLKTITCAKPDNIFHEQPYPIANYISTSQITAMYKNSNNELWAADEQNTIIYYNKRFTTFHINDIPDYAKITSITTDKKNTIWVATNKTGIYVYNTKLIAHYTANDSLPSNKINALYTDVEGNIWIATDGKGIIKYNGSTFTTYTYYDNGLVNDFISCIAQDKNGLLWFGSSEGGMCSFNGTDFSHYTENDILSSNIIYSMTFDHDGNLWVGLDEGIDKIEFDKTNTILSAKHFDQYDGFTGIQNNRNAIYNDAENNLWFGTVNGLYRYNPVEDVSSETAPIVQLQGIRLFYANTDYSLYADSLSGWSNLPSNLILPHDQNHVTFDFAGIYFGVPEKEIYQVKLDGFDDDWQSIGANTSMTYSNLPSGNYTFMVKAANADNIWSNASSYSFQILKPYWQTLWFKILVALAAIGIIVFSYSLRSRQLQLRADKLEHIVAERTKELQEQKIKAVESAIRAEKSEKAKEEFLANMSHEIRTPMNAIMGMTRLLLDKEPKTTQLKYLTAIRQSSDNLLVIINDILDISKIQAGKMQLEKIPFLLRSSLNNLEEIMKFKSEEKGISFFIETDKNIPACIIGDPVRLNQILINLLGNAIKFTDKGHVALKCNLISTTATTATIAFDVEDTGIGIPEDKLQTIFESFSQADIETTRKFGGTGLGLSISKKLTELFDGNIQVSSKYNEGSHFIVTIPFEIGQEADAIENKNHDVKKIVIASSNLHILLVEDNEFNQMVAIDSLESMLTGVKIDVAENGKIALDKLNALDYNVILMDVQMPVMDGYETTKQIRKLLNTDKSNTPIIAMTASVIKSEVDKCFECGMNDYVPKPFETEELIDKIFKFVKLN